MMPKRDTPTSTRTARRRFTKGAAGRETRRRRYYTRFRGGDNRAVRERDARR